MSKMSRWYYLASEHGIIPGLEGLQMAGFQSHSSTFRLGYHVHEHSYEFVYIEKGRTSWEVDGADHITNAGDMIFTRPGKVHRGRRDIIEPCRMWWLLINVPVPPASSTDSMSNWFHCTPEEAVTMKEKIEQLPRIQHIRSGLADHFRKLKKALEQQDSLLVLKARQSILNILLAMIEQHVSSRNKPENEEIVADLTRSMRKDWSWRPTVKELADRYGYSVSHFHKIFYEQTGLSPIAFMERMRIEEACRMLQETPDKIITISTCLGYATSQNFATSFLRHTGRSPSVWRKQV